MADANGFPGPSYVDFYDTLAKNGVGGIITGFAFTSREGRAMQPRQAGIDHPDKIPYFRKMTGTVHRHNCPVFLQVSHTGRQSLKMATGSDLRGVSSKRSVYFRERPVAFSASEVYDRIDQYARAALYAKEAGFDGIQLHAAHGYLIHQFILPAVNNRQDEFGLNSVTGIGTAFLEKAISSVRDKCGMDFPILVKISGAVDIKPAFSTYQFVELVRFLDGMEVSAIEISYGTMDHALNIFRGDMPESLILSRNPVLKARNRAQRLVNRVIMKQYFKRKLKPFTPAYNLEYAAIAKKYTRIPVISVGGFRDGEEIRDAVSTGKTDLVGLARPFICEPDFVEKIKINGSHRSLCMNCNYCSVMCDSANETRCYKY
jgi:2,4-dienoyl-CoA reductase-like NADH-dependent reductase (Old Yellow Enzyme family)